MRGRVHAIHVREPAGVVGRVADRAHVGPGADRVRGGGHGDQPGAVAEDALDRLDRQFAGLDVELGDTHGRAGALCGQPPGPDVGVVIERGHDHLVARSPGARERVGDAERQRRHARSQDDPFRHAADEIGDRGPGLCHDLTAHVARGERTTHVCHRRHEALRDGVDDRLRRLRPAGTVEGRDLRRQPRELSTETVGGKELRQRFSRHPRKYPGDAAATLLRCVPISSSAPRLRDLPPVS